MDDDAPDKDPGGEDPGSSEGELKKALPEGLRVVSRQRKSRRKSKGSRQTLFLKKRDILREMHEDEGVLNVKEQVQRLKDIKKAEEVPLEDRWGSRKHRRRGTRWILLVVFAVVIPILAILVGISLLRGPTPERTIHVSESGLNLDETETEFVPYDSTSPVAWFRDHLVDAYQEAVGILEQLGDGSELPVGLLRDAERLGPVIAEHGAGWETAFNLDPRRLQWEYDAAGDTGFLAISGRHLDQNRFRAYFVKTDDGLRLDWEATTAQCAVPVKDLVAAAPESPAMLRGWVGKQPHFDSESGRGGLFSWYQILNADRSEFVWAYAPTGSQLDQELKALLDYGLFVLDRKLEERAIVRLVKPRIGFRPTEFEVVELITKEWVMP